MIAPLSLSLCCVTYTLLVVVVDYTLCYSCYPSWSPSCFIIRLRGCVMVVLLLLSVGNIGWVFIGCRALYGLLWVPS